DHPARRLPDLERLAAGDDRVPGIRAALVAAHDIRLLGEQVDDLALAFVAPLRADHDGRGHRRRVARPSVGESGKVTGDEAARRPPRPRARSMRYRDAATLRRRRRDRLRGT